MNQRAQSFCEHKTQKNRHLRAQDVFCEKYFLTHCKPKCVSKAFDRVNWCKLGAAFAARGVSHFGMEVKWSETCLPAGKLCRAQVR